MATIKVSEKFRNTNPGGVKMKGINFENFKDAIWGAKNEYCINTRPAYTAAHAYPPSTLVGFKENTVLSGMCGHVVKVTKKDDSYSYSVSIAYLGDKGFPKTLDDIDHSILVGIGGNRFD